MNTQGRSGVPGQDEGAKASAQEYPRQDAKGVGDETELVHEVGELEHDGKEDERERAQEGQDVGHAQPSLILGLPGDVDAE